MWPREVSWKFRAALSLRGLILYHDFDPQIPRASLRRPVGCYRMLLAERHRGELVRVGFPSATRQRTTAMARVAETLVVVFARL